MMKHLYILTLLLVGQLAFGQIIFEEEVVIPEGYAPMEVVMPPSPLSTQVVFVGGYDVVQTTPTYGNPAGQAIAKE